MSEGTSDTGVILKNNFLENDAPVVTVKAAALSSDYRLTGSSAISLVATSSTQCLFARQVNADGSTVDPFYASEGDTMGSCEVASSSLFRPSNVEDQNFVGAWKIVYSNMMSYSKQSILFTYEYTPVDDAGEGGSTRASLMLSDPNLGRITMPDGSPLVCASGTAERYQVSKLIFGIEPTMHSDAIGTVGGVVTSTGGVQFSDGRYVSTDGTAGSLSLSTAASFPSFEGSSAYDLTAAATVTGSAKPVDLRIAVARAPSIVLINSDRSYLTASATGADRYKTSFIAEPQVKSTLTYEFDSALIHVFVEFDDGNIIDVLRIPGSEVVVTKNTNSSFITLLPPGFNSQELHFWRVMAARGAQSTCLENELLVQWSVCGNFMMEKNTSVHLEMPQPIALTASPNVGRITPQGDDCSRTPINIPTTVEFNAIVVFDNGDTADYTDDPRISYRLRDGDEHCGSFNGNVLTLYPSSNCTSVVAVVEYTPTGETEPTLVVSTTSITVVTAVTLLLQGCGYPSYNEDVLVDTLGFLQCTNTYDRATIKATAVLSDSTTHSVGAQTSFVVTGPATLESGNVLVPTGPGNVTVAAQFGLFLSAKRTITVVDEVVNDLTALSWNLALDSQNTLRITRNTDKDTVVSFAYADGRTLANVRLQSAWVNLADVVTLSLIHI